jgi:hypothetical protein
MNEYQVIEEYEIEEFEEAEIDFASMFDEELIELRGDLLHQVDEIEDELERRESRYQEH